MNIKLVSLRRLFAIGLVILFTSSLCFSRRSPAETKREIHVPGKTLTDSLAGFDCVVQLQAMKTVLTEDESGTWWGAYSKEDLPKSTNYVVSHLIIRYHHQPILVPVSAFSALTNVFKVAILKTGSGCEISLRNNDEGYGYTAKLLIKQVGKAYTLKQRVIRHNEAPEDWWETTTYSDPFAFQ